MCQKIKMARNSLANHDFLLIARTDAIAVEGLSAAISRAQSYQKAGADMIFVEAPETLHQIEEIARQIPGPKLINMFQGGKTPLVPVEQLKALGYQIVIIPSDLQRAAIKAMQKTLDLIHRKGNSALMVTEMVSFKERESIVGTKDYLDRAQLTVS
jgi:2-methylisocitrate lyase-like PEP mutase family enzyme